MRQTSRLSASGVGGADNLSEQDDGPEELADDFALESPAGLRPTKTRKPRAAKGGGQVELTHYSHPQKRKNNPEVGMVNAAVDPDQPSQHWAYDPHIDPALQFDTQRSAIESLIDDALASGDNNVMRDALAELKRLQAPYLNWAGKAERTSFDVDTVSLHVHERIDPATILAGIRKQVSEGPGGLKENAQPWLFDPPFEALPLRQALDFYGHDKGWANRLVAGDSLLVMNSLLQKEGMAGQVQMIYFDPPYGIKYGSNFQPFTNKKDVKDGSDADLTQEPEMIKAFRDTWELGIHSYLSYLRDRITLFRELLSDTGSIFIQISSENLHRTRLLLDEVFGSENYIETIGYRTKNMTLGGEFLEGVFDYIIWYARDKSQAKFRRLYTNSVVEGDSHWNYYWINGRLERMNRAEIDSHKLLPEGADPVQLSALYPTGVFETGLYDFDFQGKTYSPATGRCWKSPKSGLERVRKAGRIVPYEGGATLRYALRLSDYPVSPLHNIWADTAPPADKIYAVQTGHKVIERCLQMVTDPGDLVFDPTCGSGTTAYVAEKWGRRWITCDTSRVSLMLAKQRIMTSGFEYYDLRYPSEGLRGGFVYKTAPHVTLKSISNNPEIDSIYEDLNPAIQKALGEINRFLTTNLKFVPTQGKRQGTALDFAAGDKLFDYEVPFEFPPEWPAAARAAFNAFHAARREMQSAMDRSIAGRTDHETLFDQPARNSSKLRVAGPFTVEAVPSPIVASLDGQPAPAADASIARSGETSRQSDWRDELLKTGIRGKGGQILRIASLEIVPGCRHLHAIGPLADDGSRIVVSFGPEHAPLEQRQVERALEEAASLVPKPKLVVFCAFSFDPEAAKDIDEANWPGVTLLKAQMNTDLLTEDLKKARSSNQSFWLMGQPDVEVSKADGRWQVQVNGFDYFDTKSGTLVSGGKKNIAMWSLDTDYDGRALFPRQTFFPMAGAKDGWNRLKANIKAELDPDLLDQFHGTLSLPFDAGEHRRVAVKIVDDRGIESLKIVALDD
ncbi:site-specific DNA-methyltransferase [soil metagenome]